MFIGFKFIKKALATKKKIESFKKSLIFIGKIDIRVIILILKTNVE